MPEMTLFPAHEIAAVFARIGKILDPANGADDFTREDLRILGKGMEIIARMNSAIEADRDRLKVETVEQSARIAELEAALRLCLISSNSLPAPLKPDGLIAKAEEVLRGK